VGTDLDERKGRDRGCGLSRPALKSGINPFGNWLRMSGMVVPRFSDQTESLVIKDST
jgi:hypothetical protein